VSKDLAHFRFLIFDFRFQSKIKNRKSKIFLALYCVLFLCSLLAAALAAPVLADHDATWGVSYQYSEAINWPISRPKGSVLITLEVAVTASGKVEVKNLATNETQIANILNIGAHGFSNTFAMDQVGQYRIKETYTLTIEVEALGTAQSFTHTDTWDYFNSTASMVLFQMNNMYVGNYSSQIVPSGTVKIDNITPSSCKPGGIVSMDIVALRKISAGECIINSISLSADWHKTSSLTPIVDDERPTIIHSRIEGAVQAGSPITAVVTDNLKVDSVFLRFKEYLGSSFQQIEMTLADEPPDTYVGYIPLNAAEGWGKYQFRAKDVAGNETIYPPIPYPIQVLAITLGDVNDDGSVTDDDATLVLRCAVGLTSFTSEQRTLGDVSGDDTISSFDAALIMQYARGLIGTFPVASGGQAPSGITVGVIVSNALGAPRGDVTVPIDVNNNTEPEIIGIDMTLTYDPEILTAINITTVSGWKSAYSISNGRIIIGMASHRELTGEGAFVSVNFSVSENASGGQGSLLALFNVSLNEGGVSADRANGFFKVIDQMELDLYPGWNFVSVYFDTENYDLLSVLGPIIPDCRSVWTYDANGWKRYVPGSPHNDLSTIVHGKGYLIDMERPARLVITGKQITDTNISLRQGWNMIGPKSLEPKSPGDVLFGYSSIWTYDRGSWLKRIVGSLSFLSDFNQLEPGKGYWVYVK